MQDYASCVVGFADHRPIYDAISCRLSQEGLNMNAHNVRRINHWVVAFKVHDLNTVEQTREDGTEHEELLNAYYLSLSGLVVKTMADGDLEHKRYKQRP